MPQPSKRRRLSLLTLPIVVGVAFLVVAKLAAWQRAGRIADLAHSISHGEAGEATVAVYKLATISNPPISVLVTAAASDEPETAAAAQVSIDRLLRRWQRDIESQQRYSTIASQLIEMAKSLAATRTDFSDSDYAWLESAVRQILQLANKFPQTETPLVAVHCDAILSAIGACRVTTSRDKLPDVDDCDHVVAGKPDDKAVAKPTFAAMVDSRQEDSVGANAIARRAENSPVPDNPPATTEPILHSSDDSNDRPPDFAPANELRIRNAGPADDETSDRLLSNPILPRPSNGSPPIFRILPATPINVLPKDSEASNRKMSEPRATAEVQASRSRDSIAVADSRELLRAWLASENGDTLPIERELAKRGFGRLSKPLVRQFFSDNPRDRISLVDKLLIRPGDGSEAWLLLLAGDADADVRLFAVTFMATSNNAALVEKAWQAAIRDHDPRIADLAGRLRERREGPLRR